MTKPEVSIIIPAYNAQSFLSETVNSVLAQTHADWELIIVNDGSTDGTLRIAHGFEDDRIKVVDQTNAGVSAARNAGLAASKGTFISFLDADDAMIPSNIAMKLACLKENSVDWVFSDIALCDEFLNPTGKVLEGNDNDTLTTILTNVDPAVPGACSNVMVHRRCFENGVFFDEHLSNAADQDFSMQLAAGFSHRRLVGAYSLYRVLPGSMSKNITLYQKDHLRLFNKARQRGHLNDPRFRRMCMANVYWAIGGSWWLLAERPLRALPFFVKAFLSSPKIIIRPIRNRIWMQHYLAPSR